MGGPTQVVFNLVNALQECGVKAEIVTTNDNGSKLLNVPLNQLVEYPIEIYQNVSVPIWFLPRFSPPMKEYIFSTALTKWLWKNIGNYDILDNHYLFSYASTCAGAIARWQGIPYTVRTQGQLSPWALAQSKLKKTVYTFLIERYNLNRAAAIHCTSTGEAQDVWNFGVKTPTITLPLGVNPTVNLSDAKQKLRNLYQISDKTPILLFLSRLHQKKNPDLLLQALNKLANQNYNFHLILAGSGKEDYISYLKNLVSSIGLTSRISLPGFVTGGDKDLLLQGSDIFVLPSSSENFGIVVAEAMAASLPVIVTPGVQIAPEIIAEQAGLVVKEEVETLAQAIAQLITSPSLRQQLGGNGKRLVNSRYSWRVIAQNLTSAYSKIIEKQLLSDYSNQ